VRDARWLIQLAQSPATDDLGAYFQVAALIAERLPSDVRLPIHHAGVRMAGGHLRSQLRHYATTRKVSIDDRVLVTNTRSSNALDYALLVQDLVPLLHEYERALTGNDVATRHDRPTRRRIAAHPRTDIDRLVVVDESAFRLIRRRRSLDRLPLHDPREHRRILPHRVIETPVTRPSCCTFGGSQHKTLFVTSAQYGMSDEEKRLDPSAGALFSIELDIEGPPPDLFAM
jgi:hypothetical protein